MPECVLKQDCGQHTESFRHGLVAIGNVPKTEAQQLFLTSVLCLPPGELNPLLSPTLMSPDSMTGETQELCHVSLVAVYPSLCILDACSMGSAEGITRKHLWHLFSLDTLNSYLARDPTFKELTYKVPTRHR